MNKLTNAALIATTLFAGSASAAILAVNDPGTSTKGISAQIVAAPEFVLNDVIANLEQHGFDEQQGVTLAGDINVDGGTIMGGTTVSSHMILLNNPNDDSSLNSHENVEWVFSGNILGVMSGSNGADEVASSAELGASGTTYPLAAFGARGMEGPDNYIIAGNTLTVSMYVTQPGDWIRVITEVPEPASMALFGLGLMGLGFSRRRKNQA